MYSRTRASALGSMVLAAAMALGMPIATAHPQADTLPGGTSIEVEITSPADGALVAASAAQPVTFTGTAAVGEGVPNADTTLISVIDVSFSTSELDGCGGDPNGDGDANSILDCEIAALVALNQQAIAAGTVDEVGVVAFGSSAGQGDSSPPAGPQPLVAPDADVDGVGGADVEQVFRSAQYGSLTEFGNVVVGDGSTNFAAAVAQACAMAQGASNTNVLVAFLSDGESNTGGAATLPCAPVTATFQTFAVGSGSTCAGGSPSLASISSATGGSCTAVGTVADLPDILPDLIKSQLLSVEISVDGGAAVPVDTVNPLPPLDGPANVTWSHDLDLAAGVHEVCVSANGSDYGGTDSVTDCHSVTVATIALTPASEVNDLTTETQHTVTATVAAGADGPVVGVEVDFAVTAGPNASASGTDTTDASGEATFTWTNPNQNADGLGQDSVSACFEDDLGNLECASATKDWRDLTPPTASCTPSVNPAGNLPPGAQPGGVTSSHGFFELTAEDVIDPDPQIYVRDTGTGHVFGPYTSGTNIKWTKVGKGWSAKAMAGEVDWHLKGTGNAAVYAVDDSGNISTETICSVPAP